MDMDPCTQCAMKEDVADEWFYDSIKRYNTLQMYDLEMVPWRMSSFSDNWLCLAGHHIDRTEILCTELPRKLLLSEEESGRCKANDFEIAAGDFFDGIVRDIAVVGNGDFVVAGFKGERNLRKLQLGPENAKITAAEDNILLSRNTFEPNFAAHSSLNEIMVCKSSSDPLTRLDISSNEELSFQLPESLISMDGDFKPLYTDRATVAVLNNRNGTVAVLDTRCPNEASVYGCEKDRISHFTHAVCEDNIATLSSAGLFSLYDCRMMGNNVLSEALEGSLGSKEALGTPKLRFANSSKFSVSGFNNSVHIFEISSEVVNHIFTHTGHSFVDGTHCNCKAVTTDHLWLPKISENCIVSSSSNGSLNCWCFKT